MNLNIPSTGKIVQVETCRNFAIHHHRGTNHYYDGDLKYEYHLEQVYNMAQQYLHLLKRDSIFVLGAAWTHDLIEDCRVTYNDVKQSCGVEVAELTYALTTEKGRSRKERASTEYYQGMKNVEGAVFLKICDRLANVAHSKKTETRMLDMYRGEAAFFKEQLYSDQYKEMFNALEILLS